MMRDRVQARPVVARVLAVAAALCGAFTMVAALAFALYRDVDDQPGRFLAVGIFATVVIVRELARRTLLSDAHSGGEDT